MDTARTIGFILWALLLIGGYSLWWYFDAKKKKRLKEEMQKKECEDKNEADCSRGIHIRPPQKRRSSMHHTRYTCTEHRKNKPRHDHRDTSFENPRKKGR